MQPRSPSIALVLLLFCFFPVSTTPASPTPTPDAVTFLGGDGSSYPEAIVIAGAPDGGAGVDAEWRWLRSHFPGFVNFQQRCLKHEGKRYDIISLRTASGEDKTIYFDISAFFGK